MKGSSASPTQGEGRAQGFHESQASFSPFCQPFISFFLRGSWLCALKSSYLFSLGPWDTPSLSAVFLGSPAPKNPSPDLLLPSSCPSLASPSHPLTLRPSSCLHSPVNFCSLLRLLTILTAPSLLLPSSSGPPGPPVVSSLAPVPAAFPTPCPPPGIGGPLGPLSLLGPSPMESEKTNLSVTSLSSHCDLFSPTLPGFS